MHASTRVSMRMRVRVRACVCTRVGEGSLTLEDRPWERRVGKWSGADGAVGALWVAVSLLKGARGRGGREFSLQPSHCSVSAVRWGPGPTTTSFLENVCARHCSLSSRPRRGCLAACVPSENGPGRPGPLPPGGAGEGLLGRSAGPALPPVPKGRGSCAHSAPTFVPPFAVYGALSSSFICSKPSHSLQRGLGGSGPAGLDADPRSEAETGGDPEVSGALAGPGG